MAEKKTEDERYGIMMKKALQQIGIYSRDWTNRLPSDPGITILENLSAFVCLLEKEQEELPEKAGIYILRLLGLTPRKAAPARVLLGFAGRPRECTIPAYQRFYMGSRSFETKEETHLTGAVLTAVCRRCGGVLEKAAAVSEETGAFYFPFGESPRRGDALYLIYDRPCAEPGGRALFYADAEEPFPRSGNGQEKMGIRFAGLRWSYSVEGGYEETRFTDGTDAFIRSGEIRIFLGEKPHAARTVAGAAGYVLKCELLWEAYDVTPRIAGVSGPLLEVWQKETRIVSMACRGQESVSVPPLFEESPYLSLYAGDNAAGYVELPPGAVSVQAGEVKAVYTGVPAAAYSVLGTLYGYDGQEFLLGTEEETLEECLEIMVERKSGGTSRFWFFRPGEKRAGAVQYEYVGRIHGIRILDAGDFEGCIVRLSSWTVFHGYEGNVMAGNRFLSPGYREEFCNPARGKGGQDRESYEELKDRFRRMEPSLDAVVTERDYEQSVREIPGLCIHKVRAFCNKGSRRAVICVKPWSRSRMPELSDWYKKRIQSWLEERRLLGTELEVRGPRYIAVSADVEAIVKMQYAEPEATIKNTLEQALDYVNGPQVFGASVSCRKLSAALRELPCVERVERLRLSAGEGGGREWHVTEGGEMKLPEDALCCAGEIRCTVKRSRII